MDTRKQKQSDGQSASSVRDRTSAALPQGEDRDTLISYYHQMLLIRRFEEKTGEMYTRARIGGYCHLNLGEEATVVGFCAGLEPEDYVYTNYREHGYAIGRGIPPKAVMAELFGKETGVSRGRGGSMHLFDQAAPCGTAQPRGSYETGHGSIGDACGPHPQGHTVPRTASARAHPSWGFSGYDGRVERAERLVIVHGDRVVAAGVVLPLATSPTVEHVGTRHRAAIGITEISDAIAVVVSEETGTISLANAGRMVRNLGEARLQKVLSILDRSSSGVGSNGPRPPGLGRAREPGEKGREPREKRDDSEPDAA